MLKGHLGQACSTQVQFSLPHERHFGGERLGLAVDTLHEQKILTITSFDHLYTCFLCGDPGGDAT